MISIIIPVLNEEKNIPSLLSAVSAWGQEAEIIFSDGGSSDATRALIQQCGLKNVRLAHSPRGRALQMNHGAAMAGGSTLWFVHADSLIHQQSLQAIEKALSNGADAGCFSLYFHDSGSWSLKVIAFFSGVRARLTGIFYGDQGIFIRKGLFLRLGGFPEIPLMEDYEFSKKLRILKTTVLFLKIGTSARRFTQKGIWRTWLLMQKIKFLHRRGASPAELARIYRGEQGRALIVFTRAPVAGACKTRLLPFLSAEDCAGLQTAFLKDISLALEPQLYDVHAACEGDTNLIGPLLPEGSQFFTQEGKELGERMAKAFEKLFSMGYGKVILMGTDVPELSSRCLRQAFHILSRKDLVFGPTRDGGYYLIGMKKPQPCLFAEDMPWGQGGVLRSSVKAAEGVSLGFAPAMNDIDTPEDLRALAGRLRPQSHTGRFLGGKL